MNRMLVCPVCRNQHEAPAFARDPHYCSITCYRAGRGLDDPVTGDGRHWCASCRRYRAAVETSHCCEPDDVVALVERG